jgi:anti-sigma factor RsiW
MNCNEARQHWNLYHDSEGDPALHFRINEHLAVCSDCAQWFAQQSRLEHLLAEKLKSELATPELWDKVLRGAGLKQPVPSRRWLLLAGVAACAAAAVVLLGSRLFFPRPEADLAPLSAQWHERLSRGEESVQFHSDSDLAVEAYLRQRVSFPVRCPPRKDAGFAVRGAGTGELNGQPAAYLAGTVDSTPVSIFILHKQSLDRFPAQLRAVRRENPYHCRAGDYELVLRLIDRNAVVAVGRAPADSLEKVLNAYASYPDHH